MLSKCKTHLRALQFVVLAAAGFLPVLQCSVAANLEDRTTCRQFNGVTANFAIENASLRQNDFLRIRLMLRNTSAKRVTFPYIAAPFILHTRVFSVARSELNRRIDAPLPEPAAAQIDLAPGGNYQTVVAVDLGTYYELPPGKYYLRFYYDLRLLDDKELIEHYRELYHSSDLVLWDTRYYPFLVTK